MIKKLPFVLHLTKDEYKELLAKRPWNGKWDSKTNAIKAIKAKIKSQLIDNQDCCAYCGLPFKGGPDMQIEHIAPKSAALQPQFTFTLRNLVLACVYCNSLLAKGFKPTVELPAHKLYKKCKFLIVHPYFDDPDDHYDWPDEDKMLIQVKDDSDKGRASIEMFELDSEGMSVLRSAVVMRAKQKVEKPLSVLDEALVDEALNYPH